MCQFYNVRASVLLEIQDPYTAYCIDEVVAYMIMKMRNGEEPNFENLKSKEEKEKEIKHYTSFSEIYKKYDDFEFKEN